MCGIFGVGGVPDAAHLIHLGLYSLQHRGQESAGIVVVADDGAARAARAMGLVSEAFGPERLRELRGGMGIGHTRYSTAGASSLDNAQPVLARTRGGHIALAHNGNLTHPTQLRAQLEDAGAI